ncbi:MAG: multicopper oxidase domain-containing protein [Beutenbergiaceae bacterium]
MPISRRDLLRLGGAGVAGATLAGCQTAPPGNPGGGLVDSSDPRIAQVETARARSGASVAASLRAAPTTVDLGGVLARTWAYDDQVPGPLLRAGAGDELAISLTNDLPDPTTIHWHGLRLRNDMDGVPEMTQDAIAPGTTFDYSFVAPDPGTYFYHSHVGLQLDKGLAGVLIVDDPDEPGDYDAEWVIVLDDWADGIDGATPESILQELQQSSGGMMGDGMEVTYPHYLVNGRLPADAETFSAEPGQRLRLRIINAAADTTFRCALSEHHLELTHKDGVPVRPVQADAVIVSMGERYDAVVTVGDGAFAFIAAPEDKAGLALAILRTSAQAQVPPATRDYPEMSGEVFFGSHLTGVDVPGYSVEDDPEVTIDLTLGVARGAYTWLINDVTFDQANPFIVEQGQTFRVRMRNATHALHPMHLHGHTVQLEEGRSWQDTILVPNMATVTAVAVADNPGKWAMHCHNAFHMEAGMMGTLGYQA